MYLEPPTAAWAGHAAQHIRVALVAALLRPHERNPRRAYQGSRRQLAPISAPQLLACRWDQFKAVLDERDPEILQAFTSLELTTEGSLHTTGLKGACPTAWFLVSPVAGHT